MAQPNLENLADTIQETVDRAATGIEEIHRSIAEVPLDVMRRTGLFEQTADDIGDLQERSIGAVYDAVRSINRSVVGFASELLRPIASVLDVDDGDFRSDCE